jgi:putative endonuclease
MAAAHAYLLPAMSLEDRDHLVNLLRHTVLSDAATATGRSLGGAGIRAAAAYRATVSDAWVYILRCADGSLYTGWTVDVAKRLERHRAGKASRYTASRLPVELVYEAAMPDRTAARREEVRIKRLDRARKLELIAAASPAVAC